MTKNLKNFAMASTALDALATQLSFEAKADPRLARTKRRTERLVSALAMALKKYEVVHGRRVPAKIEERKAGAKKVAKKKKKVAKKAKAKKAKVAKPSNVVELKPKAAVAAARAKHAVKRSK